jgi:hypothetical protein
MEYLKFFLEVNIYLLLPIIIFGLIFHIITVKSEENVLKIGWWLFVLLGWIGTPIHELSHYIMCILFRYEILDMKLFRPIKGKKDGLLGYVTYRTRSNNLHQKIGEFFVGIAPMIGGSLIIYGLFRLLMSNLYTNLISINDFNLNNIMDVIIHTEYNIPKLILFLILSISISMHMSISKEDLKNAIYGIFWLEIIIVILSVIFTLINISVTSIIVSIMIMLISCFMVGLIADIITLIVTSIISR